MKAARPTHTNRARLQRILLWAGLWLACVGEHLAGALTHFRANRKLTACLRESLAYMTRVIACWLLLMAAQRVSRLPRRHRRIYGPHFERGALTRAVIGRAVRKEMRAASPREQVALLAAILRNPERIVRLLIARLEQGLTRLERHLVTREDVVAFELFGVVLHRTDTS